MLGRWVFVVEFARGWGFIVTKSTAFSTYPAWSGDRIYSFHWKQYTTLSECMCKIALMILGKDQMWRTSQLRLSSTPQALSAFSGHLTCLISTIIDRPRNTKKTGYRNAITLIYIFLHCIRTLYICTCRNKTRKTDRLNRHVSKFNHVKRFSRMREIISYVLDLYVYRNPSIP